MTPEQTALLAEAVERVITAEEIEETLYIAICYYSMMFHHDSSLYMIIN